MPEIERPVGPTFQFQPDSLAAVIEALEAGDISECKAPDVKHVARVLRALLLTDDLSPGFWKKFFDDALPSLMSARIREAEDAAMQEKADQMGVGDLFRKAHEAAKRKDKKGLIPAMVDLMKVHTHGNDQAAMKLVEQATGMDIDSIRRNIARSKSRKK